MDSKAVFSALYEMCEENAMFFSGGPERPTGDAAQRLVDTMVTIQEHARSLEPVLAGFSSIYHHFDFDPHVHANGYRSLVKVVRCCLLHIIQKGRYIASNRRSIFFRMAHSAGEMEAYCSALCQLRALLYLAQRLLHDNSHGNLFFQEESGLSESFLQEYASMHKACFYGRCVGFQFTPAIRPSLQSITIGLVAFGENYKKHQSGIGVAAGSLFTSGKYALDPELRGQEYERITQNLDIHFWKTFWNITETEVLGLVSMTSVQVKVNRALSVSPEPFDLPMVSDPTRMVTICPPAAHIGPAQIQMRLISSELREGQDSEKLLALCRSEGGPISLSLGLKAKKCPPSPWLVVHYHGGGFVAQTSRSHEPYLKSWSQDLGAPLLSVDYSLAPEAPFPRALEECFYVYCWAIKNHNLLGWTGERVCLAGDSAGGNLCITVSMRAVAHGVRLPDGIMAAYPAILLTMYASPSRLLSLMDPLLPLSVLSRCLSAYVEKQVEKVSTLGLVRRDTALLFKDLKQGASNWIHSILESTRASAVRDTISSVAIPPPSSEQNSEGPREFPASFEPLRSEQCAEMKMDSSPIFRNPYMSPLLAPDQMLRGLPPVHIVACALDPMLDDSVMFAKRLRNVEQPVTLCVVDDLPHGFLSLSQLSKETREASNVCLERIREIFTSKDPPLEICSTLKFKLA
uniref:Hormone-sensitive lipase n=1 Tax=Electrophorus electricus TaxID=8005 RepID=A0A4W4H3T4_ELEEL